MYDKAPDRLPDAADHKRRNLSTIRTKNCELAIIERCAEVLYPGHKPATALRLILLDVAQGRLVPAATTALPVSVASPPTSVEVMDFLGVLCTDMTLSQVREQRTAFLARLQAEAVETGGES